MTFAGFGALVSLGLLGSALSAVAAAEKVPLKEVPRVVLDAIRSRFPGAELKEAEKGTEDDETIFEVSLIQGDKHVTVTVDAEGDIEEIETELAVQRLPRAVIQAISKAYPKATIKRAEEVIEIDDGQEEKTYEVEIVTANGKTIEVKVGPDGKIENGEDEEESAWTSDFAEEKSDLASVGRNPYIVLEPGYVLVLKGGNERV